MRSAVVGVVAAMLGHGFGGVGDVAAAAFCAAGRGGVVMLLDVAGGASAVERAEDGACEQAISDKAVARCHRTLKR